MAAGPIKILPWDSSCHNQYQLCKSLTTGQTALTAAKLCEGWGAVQGAEDNHEVVGVGEFTAIKLQVWGVADNDHAPVITLTGWPESGPGQEIGVITLAYGNFTSAATTGFHADPLTHKSIRDEFVAGTAYRGCDTYTETNDYEDAITVYTGLADYPGHAVVSFAKSQYKYFGIAVTTLAGTTLGAICVPIGLRSSNISPDGF